MDLYESMRPDLADTEGKHEDTFRAYRGLLQRFLWLADREDWTDEIFILIERGKARFWLESMDRTRSASRQGAQPSLVETPRRPSDPTDQRLAAVPTRQTPASAPAYDQRALRALLGDKGILIQFYVGPDDAFVSYSSQGLLDHYRLDINESRCRDIIGRYVSTFGAFYTRPVRGLGSCPPPSHASFMRHIGELLFPISKSLFEGAKQIIVMPDGPLWSLPFDSLELPLRNGWRRLAEVAPVFVAPSVAAIQQFRQRAVTSPPRDNRFLIVSDPTIGTSISPLPGARREAAWLRETVAPKLGVVWLEGNDATPTNVTPQFETDLAHSHSLARLRRASRRSSPPPPDRWPRRVG